MAICVNNFGGMSTLEMGALTDEFLNQLPSQLDPVRVYTGMFETSLNAPAFSLTICNLTAAAKSAGVKVHEILEYLDTRTESAWEAVAGSQTWRRHRKAQIVESPLTGPAKLPHVEQLIGITHL